MIILPKENEKGQRLRTSPFLVSQLQLNHVGSLGASLTFDNIELDGLSFLEGLEALFFDC